MIKLILPCIFVAAVHFYPAFSQEMAVIRGKIYDVTTQQPLPGATVLHGQSKGTVSDQNGYYTISIAPGKATITVRFIGYASSSSSIDVLAGQTVEYNIGLNPNITQIDQVIVSAGRIAQRVGESTVSLTLIEPQRFSELHIHDAREIINKASGIEVMDGQASIRGGSGFSYGAGSRVLALVDGLPVLGADAGNIRWQFLPLENIAQVEIIKGASSVLYGSSALNGVINFRTAQAIPQGQNSFHIESGVFDKPRNRQWVWWDSPRNFNSASFSHLKRYANTEVGFGSFVLLDQGYRRLNDEKLGRANLKLTHHNQRTPGLSYGVFINGGYSEKTDFILWENATTGALSQSETTATRLNATFFTFDPFVRLRNDERMSHELRGRFQSTSNIFPEGEMTNSDAITFLSEYQGWFRIRDNMNLTAGLLQNSSHITSLFYGNHNALNAAAYLQIDISPIERLTIVSGTRMEYNELNNIAADLVPLFRGGLNYRVRNQTFLRASWGQGYRHPSIAEKFAATALGAVRIFPSIGLQPEKGWNAEVGIKHGILTRSLNGLVDLAFFYTQNKDLIEYTFGLYPDPLTGVSESGFRAENTEYSRVYGMEIEFNVSQSMGRFKNSLNGGYVFTFPAEFNPLTNRNTDEYLKYRRKHSITLNLGSSFESINIGLSLFFKSPVLAIDDVFLNEATRERILPGFYDYWNVNNNSYLTGDFYLAYTFSQNYTVSLAVKNFTNTEYMSRPGYIQPQRHFSLRVSGVF